MNKYMYISKNGVVSVSDETTASKVSKNGKYIKYDGDTFFGRPVSKEQKPVSGNELVIYVKDNDIEIYKGDNLKNPSAKVKNSDYPEIISLVHQIM